MELFLFVANLLSQFKLLPAKEPPRLERQNNGTASTILPYLVRIEPRHWSTHLKCNTVRWIDSNALLLSIRSTTCCFYWLRVIVFINSASIFWACSWFSKNFCAKESDFFDRNILWTNALKKQHWSTGYLLLHNW